MMKREALLRAGWDCARFPCGKDGCGTRPHSSHGMRSAEWIFSVADAEIALTLVVDSGVYPESVPLEEVARAVRGIEYPFGTAMGVHLGFPTTIAQLMSDPEECPLLPGCKCFPGGTSVLAGREFVEKHLIPAAQLEQPEEFWTALEKEARGVLKRKMVERVDRTHARCAHCNGEGVVELHHPGKRNSKGKTK
jgi:hypothetical protein